MLLCTTSVAIGYSKSGTSEVGLKSTSLLDQTQQGCPDWAAHLQLAGLLILGQIAVGLEGGVGGQPDILEVLLADGVLPVGQPGDCLVMPHLCPLLPWVGVLWHRLPLACNQKACCQCHTSRHARQPSCTAK